MKRQSYSLTARAWTSNFLLPPSLDKLILPLIKCILVSLQHLGHLCQSLLAVFLKISTILTTALIVADISTVEAFAVELEASGFGTLTRHVGERSRAGRREGVVNAIVLTLKRRFVVARCDAVFVHGLTCHWSNVIVCICYFMWRHQQRNDWAFLTIGMRKRVESVVHDDQINVRLISALRGVFWSKGSECEEDLSLTLTQDETDLLPFSEQRCHKQSQKRELKFENRPWEFISK